ncbi:MAG: hypothetical protein R2941_13210 [Desulfobacterales bacterium]
MSVEDMLKYRGRYFYVLYEGINISEDAILSYYLAHPKTFKKEEEGKEQPYVQANEGVDMFLGKMRTVPLDDEIKRKIRLTLIRGKWNEIEENAYRELRINIMCGFVIKRNVTNTFRYLGSICLFVCLAVDAHPEPKEQKASLNLIYTDIVYSPSEFGRTANWKKILQSTRAYRFARNAEAAFQMEAQRAGRNVMLEVFSAHMQTV